MNTDTKPRTRPHACAGFALLIGTLGFSSPGALAQESGAPSVDALSEPAGAGEVKSKEDFLALDRDGRRAFSRGERPAVSYFVEGGARYSSPSELDGTDTEVAVARLRGGGGLSFRLNDTTDLIVRLGSEYSVYDFDAGTSGAIIPSLPGVTDPFDGVHATTFTPILRSMPETGWHWTLGGRVSWSGESGADFGDSIVGGGFGLASYDVTPTLRLGAGVNVVTRLEGGVFVFPIPVVEWDITDALQLGTTERGFGLTYFLDASWSLGVQVGFLRREYRLADSNAISGGSFTDWRVPVTLAATYSPSPKTVISARVGSEVLGEMEFNDRNGNELASRDLSPTLLVGFDLRLSF